MCRFHFVPRHYALPSGSGSEVIKEGFESERDEWDDFDKTVLSPVSGPVGSKDVKCSVFTSAVFRSFADAACEPSDQVW